MVLQRIGHKKFFNFNSELNFLTSCKKQWKQSRSIKALVDYINYRYITLNVTNKDKTFNNQISKWFISLVIKTFNLKLDSREGSN